MSLGLSPTSYKHREARAWGLAFLSLGEFVLKRMTKAVSNPAAMRQKVLVYIEQVVGSGDKAAADGNTQAGAGSPLSSAVGVLAPTFAPLLAPRMVLALHQVHQHHQGHPHVSWDRGRHPSNTSVR